MTIGAHVFKSNRVGLWIIANSNLGDKLSHVLPRVRTPIPNLTDIFLPPEAVLSHKLQCRNAGFFVSTYDVVHNTPPMTMANKMLAHRKLMGTGAIEIDLEGFAVQPDLPAMADYVHRFMDEVRWKNPLLPVRLNVPPFKGFCLPVDRINEDEQLFVVAQAYFGNQDGRLSEADVLLDLLDWGIRPDKVKIMYGAMAENPQGVRVYSLPQPEYKPITQGSVFSDDLLMDAGLL